MNHQAAEQRDFVDRYLLDELDAPLRAEFEEHLFDCPVCAGQVRTGAAFVDNAKSVFRDDDVRALPDIHDAQDRARSSWMAWFRLPSLIPSLAALGLAAIVAYQAFFLIPSLFKPQLLSASVIAPAARASNPSIAVDLRRPSFNVNFEVDAPRADAGYQCEFQRADGSAVLTMDCGQHEVASFTLALLLPANKFPAGSYVMILRGDASPQAEIQRYAFDIRKVNNNERH